MNKRLIEIRQRKEEIRTMLQGDGKIDMDAVQKELEELDAEQKEIEKRQEMAEKINTGKEPAVEKRRKPEEKDFMEEDRYDTKEYRRAFMNYVCRGKSIPAEFRDAEKTATSDIGALVPTATLNKVIEKLTSYGMILPLVTKTNYRTGVTVPTSSVKPTATWVAEGSGSDTQKKTVGSVVFTHNKLRCAVSVTLETDYMAYSAFEQALVQNLSEAMAVALEDAIINGDGSGKPTGILHDDDAGQKIEVSALNYKALTDAEGALPLAYEAGAVWVMTKKTFMGFVGMTDADGQPIARVNAGVNGQPERFLLGRRVVLTEYMKSFATTLTEGDVFAFIYKMSDYILNTNFNVGIRTYEDNETDDIVRKSILVCDGKPVDTNSLVKLTYKAGA